MNRAPDLIQAYRGTTYWVDVHPQPVALRIGEVSVDLDRVLAQRKVRCWAFITAWNPRSQLSRPWYNIRQERALEQELKRTGYDWLQGLAESDARDWPPEPGMLVFDMAAPVACRLGRRFRQNAVVAGCQGQRARLLWCDRRTTMDEAGA